MARFDISMEYLLRVLEDLINTPSPTGDTDWAISFVQQECDSMGIGSYRTPKGALVAFDEGLQSDKPRVLSAHIDTLGAIVAEIKPTGRLRLSALNGLMWPTVESEGVTISTRGGARIRGSMVLTNGAAHVNKEASSTPRNADSLEVRIDERVRAAEEVRRLGISVGDFVAFDPRFESTVSGFVRSRFLDDKACVACILAALKALKDAGVSAAQRTHCLFSNFEEVGHGGMDGIPDDIEEMLVLDMAVVGTGQNGSEYNCSICLKDSSGPYSREFSERLRTIAEVAGIDLLPDIYPHYGSDGSAYWRSGGRAQVALVGPGVDTSHGYERTHTDALRDTALLVAEYLIEG